MQIEHPEEIRVVQPSDKIIIEQIAKGYFREWGTPIEETVHRLSNPRDVGLYFQLCIMKGSRLLATAGIAKEVRLVNLKPEYKKYGPWLALFYTFDNYRNQGYGTKLLKEIEHRAIQYNLGEIYLCTHTAETLYIRNGWQSIERIRYKNRAAVIMSKNLK